MKLQLFAALAIACIVISPCPTHAQDADLAALQQRAEAGDAKAQYDLGVHYAMGVGVAQDYAKAQTWYVRAADQGLATAQKAIGDLYSAGWGVPQDDSKALSWYSKAADQGNALAQFAMGMIYMNPKGVPQDYTRAAFWLQKAADQKVGNATTALAELQKRTAHMAATSHRVSRVDIVEILEAAKGERVQLSSVDMEKLIKLYGGSSGSARWSLKHCNQNNFDDGPWNTANICGALRELGNVVAHQRACAFTDNRERAENWCAVLGKFYENRGDTEMALEVYLHAPNCLQSFDRNSERSACLRGAVTILGKMGDATRELTAVRTLCTKYQDPSACDRFNSLGGHVTVEEASRLYYANIDNEYNHFQERQTREDAERAERREEHQANFNAVLGALQGVADGSNSNALQNVANQQTSPTSAASQSPSTSLQPNPGAAPASNSARGLPAGIKIDPSNGQPIAGTCERMDRFVTYSSAVNADDALLMSIQNTSSSDLFVLVKYKRSTWSAFSDTLAGSPNWGPLHPGGSGQVDTCFLIGGKHDKYSHNGDCSRADDIVVVAVKASDLHTVPPDGYERACDAELNNVKWPR